MIAAPARTFLEIIHELERSEAMERNLKILKVRIGDLIRPEIFSLDDPDTPLGNFPLVTYLRR